MKKVAGSLKLLYSQYIELKSFSQFGSDLDADTKARLEQGERIVEVLKQPQTKPVPVALQVVIIYAVTHNYLSDIAVENIAEFEQGLGDFISTQRPEIINAINDTHELSDETEKAIIRAITDYKAKFVPSK